MHRPKKMKREKTKQNYRAHDFDGTKKMMISQQII
jgi:hypothetical protein